MPQGYTPLDLIVLDAEPGYLRPRHDLPEKVRLDSPATDVMTDLRRVTTVTIEANASIEEALLVMRENKVRLLLVTDIRNRVIGLVTSTDIQGERPIQLLQNVGGRHEELRVRDIMTPYDRLDAMQMSDVARSMVGNIVITLKRVGRHHALVVSDDPTTGEAVICGIFSDTQIGRQLGMPINTIELATSFAEVETVLR